MAEQKITLPEVSLPLDLDRLSWSFDPDSVPCSDSLKVHQIRCSGPVRIQVRLQPEDPPVTIE